MKSAREALSPKLAIALTLYLASLFAANTLGLKLMPFFWGTQLSVAVFSFPIVFLMTDVVGEVYGKKAARLFVLAGFLSILLFLAYSAISFAMPWGERALWVKDSYNQVFGVSVRIAIASLLAFAIAEYQDVVSFFFFSKKWGKRHFWLRSNLSNVWSQFLDTVIFMFVAFAGIYSLKTILLIISPWWLFKVIMGVFYTPLSYLGVYLMRKRYRKSV
ncbi:TPA: queuosine precursor transporter [Candidatus Woesearchaeota archaeon]|nr:queuosine precursor transporter [Candidatus Woesearchaeota archaeon]